LLNQIDLHPEINYSRSTPKGWIVAIMGQKRP
jgi:hypothetical protein